MTDKMIGRLRSELDEQVSRVNAVVEGADGDLNDTEMKVVERANGRVTEIRKQLEVLEGTSQAAAESRAYAARIAEQYDAIKSGKPNADVEYRTAGAYLLESYNAQTGSREAAQRLETFHRVAAHQKTPDNLGVIPDPIVGNVLNFIDASRPIVSQLSVQNMPSATWHRPKVTAHTAVAPQGAAGAAADEKLELVSQKMTITRLTANAVTYGGYVNVSRQNLDFSSPSIFDAVVNDLAAQYAIQTEAATGTALNAATNGSYEVPGAAGPLSALTADQWVAALWSAAGQVYNATGGIGRVTLAISLDLLGSVGPLFAPVNPRDAHSEGFTAGGFGRGQVGSISGVPVVASSGLASGTAVVFSDAAVEAYEQRVGTLSVVEPSVLGTQVAYAGYFTPLVVETAGVVRILNAQV